MTKEPRSVCVRTELRDHVYPKRRRREIIEPRPQGLGSRAKNYTAPEPGSPARALARWGGGGATQRISLSSGKNLYMGFPFPGVEKTITRVCLESLMSCHRSGMLQCTLDIL